MPQSKIVNLKSKIKYMKPLNLLSIGLASDHAGYELKLYVKQLLESMGANVYDYGCHSAESCDYADFVHPLAEAVENGACDYGVAMCGTANGMAITANKHQQIRAGIAWNDEISSLTRRHNNANMLCIPARFVTKEEAKKIVETFFSTDFEGGRHERRIEKIPIKKLE